MITKHSDIARDFGYKQASRLAKLAGVALAAVLALGSGIDTARAASATVTTAAELVSALDQAQTGDVITIANDITLTQDLPPIAVDLEIKTDGATQLTLDGDGAYRGFLIGDSANSPTVKISNVTFENCSAQGGDGGDGITGGGGGMGAGGAIYARSGSVELTDVYFKENEAVGGDGGANTGNTQQGSNGLVYTNSISGGGGGLGGDGGGADQNINYTPLGGASDAVADFKGGGGGGGIGTGADGGNAGLVVQDGTTPDLSFADGENGIYTQGNDAGTTTEEQEMQAGYGATTYAPKTQVGTPGSYAGGGAGSYGTRTEYYSGAGGGGGDTDVNQDANFNMGGIGGYGGGGGGGSWTGGDGGFGGGGGASYNDMAGSGGFGGGGGGSMDQMKVGQGGFGAGDGGVDTPWQGTTPLGISGGIGGGGLGAGGALFIGENASISMSYTATSTVDQTEITTAFENNMVAGGQTGVNQLNTATNGQAIGGAAFLGNNLTIGVADKQKLTIYDTFGGAAAERSFKATDDFDLNDVGSNIAMKNSNGGIIKTGVGTLELDSSYSVTGNTYIGNTDVQGGLLITKGGMAIGDYSHLMISAGAVVQMQSGDNNNADETIGYLTGAGSMDLNGHTLTLVGTKENNPNPVTAFSGTFINGTLNQGPGTGTVVKDGTGTLYLSGDNSATRWQLDIMDGTIRVGNANALDNFNSVNAVNVYTDRLQFNALDQYTLNVDAGVAAIATDFSIDSASDSQLSIQSAINGTLTMSGKLLGPSLAVNMTDAAGVMALTNTDNTLSEIVLVDGTVQVSDTGALGRSSSQMVAQGTDVTLDINEAAAYTLTNSIQLNTNSVLTIDSLSDVTMTGAVGGSGSLVLDDSTGGSSIFTIGNNLNHTGNTEITAGDTLQLTRTTQLSSISGAGTIDLDDGTPYSLTVGLNGLDTAFSGDMLGGTTLTKTGGGKLTLTGNVGVQQLVISQGTIKANADAALGVGDVSVKTSSLTSDGLGQVSLEAVADGNSFSRNFRVAGGKELSVGGDSNFTISGDITGATAADAANSFAVNMDTNVDTITLSGAGNNINQIRIFRGTLFVNDTAALGGATVVGAGDGILGLGAGVAALGSDVQLNTGKGLTIDAGANLALNSATTGTGSLTLDGGNTVTIADNLKHSGDTTITAPTILQLSQDTSLGSIAGDGTLDLATNNLTVGSNNRDTTFAGDLTNGGSITKTGTATWNLTADQTGWGGTLAVNQGNVRLGGAGDLDFDNVTLNAPGGLVIGADNDIFGITTAAGSSISIENGVTISASAGGPAQTIASNISGKGAIIENQAGNTLTLTGSNSYEGGTTLGLGTIVLGSNTALGSGVLTVNNAGTIQASGTRVISNNVATTAALTVSGADDLTLGGVISGTGSLTKAGAGTLTLTNNNTYTGGTTIGGGGVTVGTNNAFGTGAVTFTGDTTMQSMSNGIELTNAITNAASVLTFDGPRNMTLSGGVAGAGGSLVKEGTSQLYFKLSGGTTATFGGGTTVNGGELLITSEGNVANKFESNITVNNSGTLRSSLKASNGSVNNGYIDGNVTVNNGGTYSGTGTITGTLTINDGGIYHPGNSVGLNTPTDFVLNAGSNMAIDLELSGANLVQSNGYAFDIGAGTTSSSPPDYAISMTTPTNSATINGGTANIQVASGDVATLIGTPGTYTGAANTFMFIDAQAGAGLTVNDTISFTDNVPGYKVVGDLNTANLYQFYFTPYNLENEVMTSSQSALVSYVKSVKGITSQQWAGLENMSKPELSQHAGEIFGTAALLNVQGTTNLMRIMSNQTRPGFAGSGLSGASKRMASFSDMGDQWSGDTMLLAQNRSLMRSWTVWGGGYGIGGNAYGGDDTYGASFTTGGFVVAIENANLLPCNLGLYYSMNDVTTKGSYYDDQVSTNDNMMGLYLSKDMGMSYYMVNGFYGIDNYESRRQLQGGMTDTEFEGWQAGTYGEYGVNFCLGGIGVQPFGALQYVFLRQNSLDETDSGSLYDLSIDAMDVNSFRSMIGTRLAMKAPFWMLGPAPTLEMRAVWMHELLDDTAASYNAGLIGSGGSRFNAQGLSLGRDWAVLGTALDWRLGRHMRLFAGYDLELNDNETMHIGNGGLHLYW